MRLGSTCMYLAFLVSSSFLGSISSVFDYVWEQDAKVQPQLSSHFSCCLQNDRTSLFMITISDSNDVFQRSKSMRLARVAEFSTGPFALTTIICHFDDLNDTSGVLKHNGSSLAPQLFLFDSPSCPRNSSVFILPPYYLDEPLALRTFFDERYRLRVTISLSANYSRPLELRWAHFRGNTRFESLGPGGGRLILRPGDSTVQYSHAGHVFALFDSLPCPEPKGEAAEIQASASAKATKCRRLRRLASAQARTRPAPLLFDQTLQLSDIRALVLLPCVHVGAQRWMPQHRRGEVDFSVDFAPVDADPNGRGSWVGTQFLEETVDVALSTVSSVKMMMSGRDEKRGESRGP